MPRNGTNPHCTILHYCTAPQMHCLSVLTSLEIRSQDTSVQTEWYENTDYSSEPVSAPVYVPQGMCPSVCAPVNLPQCMCPRVCAPVNLPQCMCPRVCAPACVPQCMCPRVCAPVNLPQCMRPSVCDQCHAHSVQQDFVLVEITFYHCSMMLAAVFLHACSPLGGSTSVTRVQFDDAAL